MAVSGELGPQPTPKGQKGEKPHLPVTWDAPQGLQAPGMGVWGLEKEPAWTVLSARILAEDGR